VRSMLTTPGTGNSKCTASEDNKNSVLGRGASVTGSNKHATVGAVKLELDVPAQI